MDGWIVRKKRPMKKPTFHVFKRLTAALDFMKAALRERGCEVRYKPFDWERL